MIYILTADPDRRTAHDTLRVRPHRRRPHARLRRARPLAERELMDIHELILPEDMALPSRRDLQGLRSGRVRAVQGDARATHRGGRRPQARGGGGQPGGGPADLATTSSACAVGDLPKVARAKACKRFKLKPRRRSSTGRRRGEAYLFPGLGLARTVFTRSVYFLSGLSGTGGFEGKSSAPRYEMRRRMAR
jgi:hypothetical protein